MARKKKRRKPEVDVQEAKKELLKVGRERGYLTEEELVDSIPEGMITPTEMEVFFFTLDMMNVELRLSEETANTDHGRITLLNKLSGGSDDEYEEEEEE